MPHTIYNILRKRHRLAFAALLLVVVLTPLVVYLSKQANVASAADSLFGFDEGYGDTVSDSSGAASGTITGASWQTSDLCRRDKCLYFDGASWISFGDESSFDFAAATDWTIQFWFRHGPASATEVLVQKYEATGGDGGYRIQMESDGDLSFGVDDANGGFADDQITTTTANYDDNQWHFVSAVKDGTTGIYLYVDGILVGSDETIGSTGTLVNDDTFYLGDSDGTDNGDEWVGFIDELKIYVSTARTADEIKADLAGSTPDRGTSASFGPDKSWTSDGLLAYWKLDESSGEAFDTTGINPLANYNTTTFTSGKFGKGSEHVPGSSQYLSHSASNLGGVQTISFWTNPDATTNYLATIGGAAITASSGTISTSGITNPTIFVNGTASTTLAADTWQQVTVTTDTPLDSNLGITGDGYDLNGDRGKLSDIFCLSATDCKMVYVSHGADQYDTLNFMDCDDATCSSGTISVIDGNADCTLTGGDGCQTASRDINSQPSLFCPTADDCKISYSSSQLFYADCDDATCSSGSIELLNGGTGCALTGGDGCSANEYTDSTSLYCPTADDCKIAFRIANSGVNRQNSLAFADCANAQCSSGSLEALDGASGGCSLSGGDGCDTGIDTGNNNHLFCPTADDCKIAYYDLTNTALRFADCADATCSSGSVEILDGDTGCGLSGGDACDTAAATGQYPSLHCPSATDCKVSYYESTDSALMFADCADATCSTGSVEILDGATGCGLTGGDGCVPSDAAGTYSSLYCPAADDCKVSYYTSQAPDTALVFADCDDATCSTGSVEFLDGIESCSLTGGDGCHGESGAGLNYVTGQYTSLYCPSATDCKVSYYDSTSTALSFADCDDATCSTGSTTFVDGHNATVGEDIDIYCVTEDDCKMVYHDDTNTALVFKDCDDSSCSTGSVVTLDGAANCALTGADGCTTTSSVGENPSIYCPTADDCKISYYDYTNSSLRFADCDNAQCSAGSVSDVDGVSGCNLTGCLTPNIGQYSSIFCPAADDCKIAYANTSGFDLRFADCDDATCTSGTVSLLDGDAACTLTSGDGCDTASFMGTNGGVSLSCPTATDCKIAYYDHTNSGIRFGDCADATCSSGSVEYIDGMTGCSLSGGDGCNTALNANSPDLACPAADDCKISFFDQTNDDLRMADCDDATCSTGSVEVVDGTAASCGLTGCASISTGPWNSIACPAADDCKISYRNSSATLMMADCDDATCSSGTVNTLDGSTGTCSLTSGYGCSANTTQNDNTAISCPSSTTCRIGYFDNDFEDVRFGACTDASCSTGSVQIADTGFRNQFYLGRTGSSYYDGTFDDVRVYNRTLSPAEVQKLYQWAPGPVAHWKLDENTGTSAFDSSGNGYTGTLTGSPSWSTGRFGSAIALNVNGVAEYISVSDPSSGDLDFSNTVDYTIEAWVKFTAIEGGGSGATYLVRKNFDGNPANAGYSLTVSDGAGSYPAVCSYCAGGSCEQTSALYSTTMNDGSWHHIACVMDRDGSEMGTAGLYVFVDGVVKQSDTTLTVGSAENSQPLLFGEHDSAGELTNGGVDDVRIYRYARTQAQIIEDMNAGHPAPGSPVGSAIAHWKFDEGALNTCSNGTDDFCDAMGNGNDLAFSTTTGGFTNSGKFGKAFNGTGAVWASRADDSDFDVGITEDYTISLWYKADNATNPSTTEYLVNKAGATTAGYAVYANSSDQLCFGIDDDTSWGPDIASCTTTDVYDTSWHHLVAVRDYTSTDKIYLYIDGVLMDSDTDTTTATLANSLSLYLGDRDGTDNGDEFTGDLDEVKIYRLALTAEQVKAEYNQGAASVWGALSTDSSGNPSWGATDAYCPPGQGSACTPPVAEWLLDEKTGTGTNVIKDTSESGFDLDTDGSITNANWTRGKFGSAMYFNGTDDRLVSADTELTATDGLSSATWSMWIKPNFTQTYANYSGMFESDGFTLYFNPIQDDFTIITNTSSGAPVSLHTSGLTWSADTWHQMTVAYDGSNVNVYWDGIFHTTDPQTGTIDNESGTSYIGYNSGSSSYWSGAIDTVRIYNYARTPAQIAWEYNRGGPVGWWQLDDGGTGNGLTLYDNSGFGNNGTSVDGGGTVLDCTVAGKRETACDLDGSNDYITIGDAGDLYDFTGNKPPFAISAWVNRSSYNTFDTIVSKDDDIFTGGNTYSLFITSTDNVRFLWTDGSNNSCISNSTTLITSTGWHHVVGVFDDDRVGTYDCHVFVDGKWEGGTGVASTGNVSNALALTIGAESDGGNPFDGLIDEVKFFRYAPTDEQIKIEYNQGAVRFE
jgi:hypothetical protein